MRNRFSLRFSQFLCGEIFLSDLLALTFLFITPLNISCFCVIFCPKITILEVKKSIFVQSKHIALQLNSTLLNAGKHFLKWQYLKDKITYMHKNIKLFFSYIANSPVLTN